jgi:hypothetical protein
VALLGDAYTEEGAVRGNWGSSISSSHPVLTGVLNRLPVTMELIVLSMAVALVIAIPAAIIGAIRQNTRADYTANVGRDGRRLDPGVLHRRVAAATPVLRQNFVRLARDYPTSALRPRGGPGTGDRHLLSSRHYCPRGLAMGDRKRAGDTGTGHPVWGHRRSRRLDYAAWRT